MSKKKGLAIFSSDALSSVAYASEEILIVLGGALVASNALPWIWPISIFILLLLVVLSLSYRQTITAYPHGGGAYTVCKENLGVNFGLLAGAALIIDYVLTVAVSIAAGAAAVTSAFPQLLEHRVLIANAAILVLMFINMRGVRESGTIFAFPTYAFVFSLFAMFCWLGYELIFHPPTNMGHVMPQSMEGVGLWMVLMAFSSGCTALTGVEAISNGVSAFKSPEQKNAKITLTWMAIILGLLFLGVSFFARKYNIVHQDHETVVSQLARQLNNSFVYYSIQASTALILFLAANTSFNAFPLVASLLAEDRFLPRQLASRGDRLVYSNGIIGLGLVSMLLIWAFNSDVHMLIPMYAIGVFLCFTLSQAGMVKYWLRTKGEGWKLSVTINGVGCFFTAVVLTVVVTTKFIHGGWLVCLLIPICVLQFRRIKYHYLIVGNQLRLVGPLQSPRPIGFHHVIVPVSGIHRGVLEALNYAQSLSKDVTACYVDITPRVTERIIVDWKKYGMGVPLKVLSSPYRSVMKPLFDFIDMEVKQHPDSMVTVIIPEFVTAKWWQNLLHNQTAIVIRTTLAFKKRVVVTSVRYHLSK